MLDHDVFYNRERSGYEEITSYMPRFWREIREMDANNRFAGRTLDDAATAMENFVRNWFFDTMDEATLTDYENFLGLTGFGIRSIQDRRNLVKAVWIAGQKMSRPRIKALVRAYLGCDSEVHFTHILTINPLVTDPESTLYIWELLDILHAQVPAHISWELITAIAYGGGANISVVSVRHWIYPFELCGTNPDVSTLGEAIEDDILVNTDVETYGYPHTSTAETPAGTSPDTSTAGAYISDGVNVNTADSSNTYDVPVAQDD